MSEVASFDPYRSPVLPEGPPMPVGARPGWLTALCVVCIVLGSLGMLNSLFGSAGLIAGKQIQRFAKAQPSPGMSQDMQDAQDKFQDELYGVQLKYWWPLAIGLLLRFVVALLLVVGGARALGLAESGRRTLLLACALALPFELAHTILQSLIMLENMTAMNTFAEKLANEMPKNGPEGMQNFIQYFFRGAMIFSLVIMFVMALLKIGLYLFGLLYLQKDRIKQLFAAAPLKAALAP